MSTYHTLTYTCSLYGVIKLQRCACLIQESNELNELFADRHPECLHVREGTQQARLRDGGELQICQGISALSEGHSA